MAAATNIPISATTTDYVGAVNAAIAATGNFDRAINQQLITSFRALDRETRLYEQGLGRVARIIETQAADAARAAAQAAAASAVAAQAQRVQNIGNGFRSVGQSLTMYLTAPLALASGAAFNAYAQIDGMVKGLKAATGSAEEAKKQFQEFYEISKKPGLGLEQTVAAGLQLETLGYQAKTAQKYVAEVGNAIALGGKGKVEFGSVMTQFTQMAGKAKVLGDDLKPIVNASPIIAKAIQNLFGTTASEDISKKLQAAGKGPKDFIEMLVNELSKVERVEGGPKNALENIGDAAAIASYNIAGAADKILDITGKINGVSDFISRAAESFAAMTPVTQSVILGLVGIAGAAGPVSLGIGTIIKLLPTLKLGFASLTGPIGLAALAAVAAVTLIIANWEKIEPVLVNSGVWDTVKNIISAATDTIIAIWEAYTSFLKAAWDGVKAFVIPIAQYIGSVLKAIFQTLSGVLTGIFKTLTGIITGDWQKLREGMQNITAALWNGVVSLFSAGITATGNLFAAFLQTMGATGLADTVRAKVDGIAKSVDGVKIALIDAQKVGKDGIGLAEVTVKAKRTAEATPTTFLGKTDSGGKAVKEKDEKFYSDLNLNKRIAERLEREIQDANGKGVDDKIAQLAALRREIERLEALTSKNQKVNITGIKEITDPEQNKRVREIVDNFHDIARTTPGLFAKTGAKDFLNGFTLAKPSIEFFQTKMEELKNTIATMGMNNLKIPKEAIDSLAQYVATLRQADRAQHNATTQAEDQAEGDRMNSLPVVANFGLFKVLDDSKDKMVDVIHTMKENISSALKDTATAAFTGMGEVIGGLVAGTTGIESIPGLLLGTLGGLLKQLGQIAIQAAIGLTAIQTALKTLNPAVALVAGVGLIALGTVIQSSVSNLGSSGGMKRYAKGGVFDSTSVGIFGEYAGASMNKEIATPERLMASTFRSELNNYGGRIGSGSGSEKSQRIEVIVKGKIEGKDINLANERYASSREDYN